MSAWETIFQNTFLFLAIYKSDWITKSGFTEMSKNFESHSGNVRFILSFIRMSTKICNILAPTHEHVLRGGLGHSSFVERYLFVYLLTDQMYRSTRSTLDSARCGRLRMADTDSEFYTAKSFSGIELCVLSSLLMSTFVDTAKVLEFLSIVLQISAFSSFQLENLYVTNFTWLRFDWLTEK